MKNLLLALSVATITLVACKKEPTGELTPVKANFTYSSSHNYAPAEFHFTNTSFYATSYSWDFGDSSVSKSSEPIHTYLLPGTYNVTLIASANGKSSTITKSIEVLPPPTKVFLNEVIINNTNLTRPSGGNWDSDLGPDIYYKIYALGREINKSITKSDVTKSNFPLKWTSAPPIEWCSINSTDNDIVFWDDDGLAQHENMLAISLAAKDLSGLNYPSQLTYKLNGNDIIIKLSYQ
ncbi:MAG: PKD domain-containing protein [Bacteroidia bacterium]|nr:PKD domain-containing protein [Bacteroidia bacterium]